MRWLLPLLTGCTRILGIGELEAPTDAAPPIDQPLAIDASSTASIGAGDEDNDGIENRDDPCPTIPGTMDGDADADGIGDACDPRPGSRDRLVAFYGFEDANELGMFLASGEGAWKITNDGKLEFSGDVAQANYLAYPTDIERAFVTTAIARPNGSAGGACVDVTTDVTGDHAICGFVVPQKARISVDATVVVETPQDQPVTEHVIRMSQIDGTARLDLLAPTPTGLSTTDLVSRSGTAGLVGASGIARFDYFMLVEALD